MGDSSENPRPSEEAANSDSSATTDVDPETVEDKFDFDTFGPPDMAQMTVEEWEAAFDPDTWITGPRLLARVEADLRDRVHRRDIFAVIERVTEDGADRILAYTDAGYALVYPDGSVEGFGAVLRDVKPVVALCSMDDYDIPDPPEGESLPTPADVPEGSGQLGNTLLQVLAGILVIAGLALIIGPLVLSFDGGSAGLLTIVIGLGFLVIGGVLLILVANARLSDRFRAEEYRDRLRAAGVGTDERPAFLPDFDTDDPDAGEEA